MPEKFDELEAELTQAVHVRLTIMDRLLSEKRPTDFEGDQQSSEEK